MAVKKTNSRRELINLCLLVNNRLFHYLLAKWKILPIGKGPAISLYAFGFQILKFDCFGATDGHFHLFLGWPSPTNEDRIWLPKPSATAQVERAIFELRRNVPYYFQRHADEGVRRLRLEPATWSPACTQARDKMLHFLCSVPELADVK
jgi:hypothetical protein